MIVVFLHSNVPFELPATGAVRDALWKDVRSHPAVLGVVDVVSLVNNRCIHPGLCSRWSVVVNSHHPTTELHHFIANDIRVILLAHKAHLHQGPGPARFNTSSIDVHHPAWHLLNTWTAGVQTCGVPSA